jgi:hypothetical protein
VREEYSPTPTGPAGYAVPTTPTVPVGYAVREEDSTTPTAPVGYAVSTTPTVPVEYEAGVDLHCYFTRQHPALIIEGKSRLRPFSNAVAAAERTSSDFIEEGLADAAVAKETPILSAVEAERVAFSLSASERENRGGGARKRRMGGSAQERERRAEEIERDAGAPGRGSLTSRRKESPVLAFRRFAPRRLQGRARPTSRRTGSASTCAPGLAGRAPR